MGQTLSKLCSMQLTFLSRVLSRLRETSFVRLGIIPSHTEGCQLHSSERYSFQIEERSIKTKMNSSEIRHVLTGILRDHYEGNIPR